MYLILKDIRWEKLKLSKYSDNFIKLEYNMYTDRHIIRLKMKLKI